MTAAGKRRAGEPRQAELEYLLDLGEDVDGPAVAAPQVDVQCPAPARMRHGHRIRAAMSARARSPLALDQGAGGRGRTAIGKLARALAAHEGSLAEEQEPPDSWVILLSRINRGELGRGKDKLRQAVDRARVEFNRTHEERKPPVAFQEAAE